MANQMPFDVLDAVGHAVIVLDSSGRILNANEAASRLLGFRSGEASAAKAAMRANVEMRAASGVPLSLEDIAAADEGSRLVDVRRPNGTRLWASVHAGKAYVAGTPVVVTAWEDVTQRRRLENALRVSEKLLVAGGHKGTVDAALETETVLLRVAELFVTDLADWCYIELPGGDGDRRRVVRHSEPERASVAAELQRYPWPLPPEIETEVAARGRAHVILEPRLAPVDERHERLLAGLEPGSAMVVPLVARGHVLGLAALFSRRHNVYDDRHVGLAEDIGRRAAVALDNSRLYEAERAARADAEKASSHLRFLLDASAALAASLDLSGSLSRLAGKVVEAFADVCMIDLVLADGSIRRMVVRHADPAQQDAVKDLGLYDPQPDSANPAARVIRTGRSEFAPNMDDEFIRKVTYNSRHFEVARALCPLSYICVPLRARRRILGSLSLLTTPRSGKRYGPEDLALAEALAQRAAIEIDNTRLYEDASRVSSTLQTSLLPPDLPASPHAELAGRYRPAGNDTEVGGDWYDAFFLPGGELALAVGDVVGRGVRAAASMGQLRMAVRAYALDGHTPAIVLERLHRLVQSFHGNQMSTLIYGVYDPRTMYLRFARAGHPPPLVITGATAEYLIEGNTAPLGVANEPIPEALVALKPGTTLLMYTDGLIEHRDFPIDEGLSSLLRTAVDLRERALDDLCGRLIDTLLSGRESLDDAALLGMRTTPEAPVLVG